MELIDITPEDSIIPVYLEALTEEEQEIRDADNLRMQQEQEQVELDRISKEEFKASGISKLIALGLTEEEAVALING
jgi:hypothetical protein